MLTQFTEPNQYNEIQEVPIRDINDKSEAILSIPTLCKEPVPAGCFMMELKKKLREEKENDFM